MLHYCRLKDCSTSTIVGTAGDDAASSKHLFHFHPPVFHEARLHSFQCVFCLSWHVLVVVC